MRRAGAVSRVRESSIGRAGGQAEPPGTSLLRPRGARGLADGVLTVTVGWQTGRLGEDARGEDDDDDDNDDDR